MPTPGHSSPRRSLPGYFDVYALVEPQGCQRVPDRVTAPPAGGGVVAFWLCVSAQCNPNRTGCKVGRSASGIGSPEIAPRMVKGNVGKRVQKSGKKCAWVFRWPAGHQLTGPCGSTGRSRVCVRYTVGARMRASGPGGPHDSGNHRLHGRDRYSSRPGFPVEAAVADRLAEVCRLEYHHRRLGFARRRQHSPCSARRRRTASGNWTTKNTKDTKKTQGKR
jgi:hypothetical protein